MDGKMKDMGTGGKAVEAAIFDLDGTVVENDYDWPRIRKALGSGDRSILAYLEELEEPERSRKRAVLEAFEAEQTARSTLREGVPELLDLLRAKAVRTALVTNNNRRNADLMVAKFGLEFDLVMTRETRLWKPSGAPFLEVFRIFGTTADRCLVIGDTRYDLDAARDAGIDRVFLISDRPGTFEGSSAEVFATAQALRERLEKIL